MDLEPASGRGETRHVLIIGGGPAGIAAALACMDSGLSVAIVTRSSAEATPAPRPWESLHPSAVGLLASLGLDGAARAAAVGPFSSILRNGLREPIDPEGGAGLHVRREVFDPLLLEAARRRGAVIFEAEPTALEEESGVQSVHTGCGKRLHAWWVIDASGKSRVVSRLLRRPVRRLGPALVTHSGLVPAGGEGNADPRFDSFDWGWIWRTQEVDRWATWTGLHAAKLSMPAEIASLRSRSLPGSVRTVRATWVHGQPVASDGWFAVGDAAGSLDPASGQGILGALTSGAMAAGAICAIFSGSTAGTLAPVQYHRWFLHRIRQQADQLRSYYEGLGILDLK